jgi:alkanesulfonate monooxygenase SsuD/methylene tetrahydromethanopterin reductase-like flavin-dependent oxidoreductase (luciferase family)
MAGDTQHMKIGLFLTPWLEGGAGDVPRWADVLEKARLAEAVGFDSIWVSDHLLMRFPGETPRGGWEGWSLVAALAVAVERVEIGTLVLCTAWRNPALLAKMASTVDEISDGRLILGLGAGWHEPEFRAFDFPFDNPISRFEEALAVVCPLLRAGRVDFSGRFYEARDCELRPRGRRPQGPPIMIGALANRSRLLRLTASYADMWNGWLPWADNRPPAIPSLRAAVDAACLAAGRDPVTLARSVTIQIDYPSGRPNHDPSSRPLVGTPEELAEVLRGFAREGIDHLQVLLNPNTPPTIKAFAPVLKLLA